MTIYIIRHGQTDWNLEGRLQGHSGADLNENGVSLAVETAQHLADIPFDLCYTSPALRAKHTAELILAGRGVPVIEEPSLMEIGFGIWEGIQAFGKNAEIHFQPEVFQVFLYDPMAYIPPEGGESISDVLKRTNAFLDELLTAPDLQDKTILLSTHGCASRALMNRFYENPEKFWQEGVPGNCAVSRISVTDGVPSLTMRDHVYCQADTDDMWAKQEMRTTHEDK